MYWKVVYTNETGYLIKKEFVIANNYKEVAVYVEKRIKNTNHKILYYIDKIPKLLLVRRINEVWIDLRE